jgi:hypothetical protein
MVVRKCGENDKDALRWCVVKPDKRKSRKMTNKLFSAKMYDLMDWNTDCRYKILGHKITYADETIYVFDLMETEIFWDIKQKKKTESTVEESLQTNNNSSQKDSGTKNDADEKPIRKKNRIPFYPEEWKDSFGLPVEEHKKALEINILDGYVEFSTS